MTGRGALVYERADAAQNGRFIELCMAAAAARSMALSLLFAEALPGAIARGGLDWALARTRNAAHNAALEAAGVRVFNRASVCALCNDKRETYLALHRAVPMLPTLCDAPAAPPFLPCVVKPAWGHGGENVRVCKDAAAYRAAIRACEAPLVQPLADPGRDMRLYVVGGKVVCAMLRENAMDFRSNYKLGGQARPVEPGAEALQIAGTVCARYAPDYIGVDIICDKGRPVLNELEDPVGARMVYENTPLRIVELLFDHIERVMDRGTEKENKRLC